jgi:hypothetical protein
VLQKRRDSRLAAVTIGGALQDFCANTTRLKAAVRVKAVGTHAQSAAIQVRPAAHCVAQELGHSVVR